MRRKRSRAAELASRRHKSAKRQIKKGRRFVQFNAEKPDAYYIDQKDGRSYPGTMPKVLTAYQIEVD